MVVRKQRRKRLRCYELRQMKGRMGDGEKDK